MSGAGEAFHVWAQFGNDDLSGLLIDAGDRVPARHQIILVERAHQLVNLLLQALQFGVQVVDMLQMQGQQQPVVDSDGAGQGPFQVGDLVAHPARGQLGQRGRIILARHNRGEPLSTRHAHHVGDH